jgi:hypothetical protein
MWKLLASVVSSFLLLRDLFGYLIPGAVFLAALALFPPAGAEAIRIPGRALADVPYWIAVIAAMYVAGQILVAIGYFLYFVAGPFIAWRWPLRPAERTRQRRHQEQLETDLVYYRYVYPAMFNDRDRRATINILRIGLATAFLIACWLLPLQLQILGAPLRYVAFFIGLLLLYNGYTGGKHVYEYTVWTVAAARKAERQRLPYFSWNGSKASE